MPTIKELNLMMLRANDLRTSVSIESAFYFIEGYMLQCQPSGETNTAPSPPPKPIKPTPKKKTNQKKLRACVINIFKTQTSPLTIPEIRELVAIEYKHIASDKVVWNRLQTLLEEGVIQQSEAKSGRKLLYELSPKYKQRFVILKDLHK